MQIQQLKVAGRSSGVSSRDAFLFVTGSASSRQCGCCWCGGGGCSRRSRSLLLRGDIVAITIDSYSKLFLHMVSFRHVIYFLIGSILFLSQVRKIIMSFVVLWCLMNAHSKSKHFDINCQPLHMIILYMFVIREYDKKMFAHTIIDISRPPLD